MGTLGLASLHRISISIPGQVSSSPRFPGIKDTKYTYLNIRRRYILKYTRYVPGFVRIFVRWCFCNIFSAVSPGFTSDVASEGGILASPAAQETLPLAWSWQLPKWGEDRESGKQNDLFRDQFAWRIIGISRMHLPYLAMFSLCHRCLKYPRKLNIMISI